jgi:Pectate lyase superfamily protein
VVKRLLWLAALAFGLGVALPTFAQSPGNFSTLSTTGTASLGGSVLVCSGQPWIDVRCNGAVGDDSHDDTTAISTTIAAAITNNWPVHFPAGTYKITSRVVIDYAGQATKGFRLISEGATIDGQSIAAGPVLQIECSGGSPGNPTGCFYFKEEGTLFVSASTPAYAVVLGKTDFSDAHNSAKFDHLVVHNASTAPAAGGCQFNFVLDSDIYAVCVSTGGAAGLALEQTQFSRISGAGTAEATGGRGLVLENGYNFSNVFFGLDLEVSPICLSITFNHNGLNTFVSPYFDCQTAINATASIGNVLINPNYGGATVNYGPVSTGVTVIGSGSRSRWLFPTAASYTAAPVDDGLNISSYNTPGASLSVTLPPIASLNAGWTMGFATDNGRGLTVTAPSGAILSGGKAVSSIVLGPGNYENVVLQSDGNNWRVISSTRSTRLANGFDPPPWPSNWLYPSTPGYAATLGDNGNILSSFNTTTGLTVTLPPTTGLPTGWSMGFATDSTKPLSVQVNQTSGGNIVWPGSGALATTLTLANTSQGAYEFLALQYDGSGNFRVVDATPATAQAIGMIGASGISHWSFPAVSAYAASVADSGSMVSSFNSPVSYLAVTLPSTTAIPMGWTIGIASDSNKTASVQVNGTSGGHILFPGSGAVATSASLAAGNYEQLVLQFDGSNFRVVGATPATATQIGITGNAPGVNRWSFPAVSTYAAAQSDNGNAVSSYNTPAAALTVTLPATNSIGTGWIMGFATDNGKTMTVQVNGGAGEKILVPAAGGTSSNSITLAAGQNYEYAALQFDGSNFRVVTATPQTLNNLGGLVSAGSPASSSACMTNQITHDSEYLYICTAPNTWKRAPITGGY